MKNNRLYYPIIPFRIAGLTFFLETIVGAVIWTVAEYYFAIDKTFLLYAMFATCLIATVIQLIYYARKT